MNRVVRASTNGKTAFASAEKLLKDIVDHNETIHVELVSTRQHVPADEEAEAISEAFRLAATGKGINL